MGASALLKNLIERIRKTSIVIINSVLLTIVYFIGIGLTAIFAKIVGKRFMHYKEAGVQTYWVDKEKKKLKLEDYYRQF